MWGLEIENIVQPNQRETSQQLFPITWVAKGAKKAEKLVKGWWSSGWKETKLQTSVLTRTVCDSSLDWGNRTQQSRVQFFNGIKEH